MVLHFSTAVYNHPCMPFQMIEQKLRIGRHPPNHDGGLDAGVQTKEMDTSEPTNG
jgi:hypothetical protein